MQETITVSTDRRETLVDITEQVRERVHSSGVNEGLASVYVQGATAAIMIQENWDESVQTDVVNSLPALRTKNSLYHNRRMSRPGDGDGCSLLCL